MVVKNMACIPWNLHMNGCFYYSQHEDVAKQVVQALTEHRGGYAELVIAEDEVDPNPVKYHYRSATCGEGAVSEGSENGLVEQRYVYRNCDELYQKIMTLLADPMFYSVAFMNKGVGLDWQKIYKFQLANAPTALCHL
jgi:hypothetical protein